MSSRQHAPEGGLSTILVRPVLAVLVAFALAVPAIAAPMPGVPEEGPDVPAASGPVAVVTVLENEVWAWSAGFRGRAIDVPTGWTRVVLEFTQEPLGDPWDRTFAASIGGVEVLRGTTPRAPMTVEKDVTRYASLLPQGGTARVEGYTDTYVGAMRVTLKLRFYDDPTALLVAPRDGGGRDERGAWARGGPIAIAKMWACPRGAWPLVAKGPLPQGSGYRSDPSRSRVQAEFRRSEIPLRGARSVGSTRFAWRVAEVAALRRA